MLTTTTTATTAIGHAPSTRRDPEPPRVRATIVALDDRHLDALTGIYRAALAEGVATWEDPVPDRAEMALRLEAVRAAKLPALAAVGRDGRVLGFAWASPFRSRAAYRGTVEDSIYVAAEARGAGIGRLLLRRLVADCAALSCRAMIAVVGDARNHASIRLHEQLGFVPAGYLAGAGWRPEGPVDVVMLQRPLAATERMVQS